MARKKETTWAGVVTRLLEHTGWSAYKLAKEAGLTQVGVLGVQDGRRGPRAVTIQKMLAAADLPWSWLDEVMEHPPKQPDDSKPARKGRKEGR